VEDGFRSRVIAPDQLTGQDRACWATWAGQSSGLAKAFLTVPYVQAAARGGSHLQKPVTGGVHLSHLRSARVDVFEYIERFYNPKRRNSTLGYLKPHGV